MKKKLLAIPAAVALLIGAGGVYLATSAEAATITSVALSSSTIVLDGDQGCGYRSTITVKANYPESDAYVYVTGSAVNAAGDDTNWLSFNNSTRSGNTVTYTDKLYICGFEDPGKYILRVTISLPGSEETKDTSFYIKRPSALTYNASPEPAKKGSKLTHKGQLKLDPFGFGPAYGAKGQKLTVAFKKSGSSTWTNKFTITTGTNGAFSTTFKTDGDGTWRASYPGSTYRQPVLVSDYVDTK